MDDPGWSGRRTSDRPRPQSGHEWQQRPRLDWPDLLVRFATAAVAALLVWLLVYATSPFVPQPDPESKSGFRWRSPWPNLDRVR